VGRKLRTSIRAAPKVQEKELIRKARELRSKPEILVPRCVEESCPRCPFDSLLEKLRRVAQVADDEARLERFSKHGPPLVRAYAATLLLAIQERASYLAPAKTPFGTVHYALRGKATKDKLVGVQYYDVPELRLLTIADIARKRGLHVYSLEDGMVTTCREDRPPAEFVEESLGRLQISLRPRDGERVCPHAGDESAVVVEWRGADLRIVTCSKCKPPKGNLPTFIGSRMIVPRLSDCFGVRIRLNLRCHGDTCSLDQDWEPSETNAQAYLEGRMGEADLLRKEVDRIIADVASSEGLLILGRECFEGDYEAFLKAVGVPEDLKPALEELEDELSAGLVVSEATTAKLLEALSRDQMVVLLKALTEDEEMAEALVEAAETEGRSAEDVLSEALEFRRDLDVVSRLPSWDELPPHAALADSVARAYKTQGEERAIIAATKGLKGSHRQQVLALAFLEALGSAGGKKWMFREEERQLAEFLVPMARELLEAEGEAYEEALQKLLTASGSGEVLPKR
jgi:hypothetical protein